MADSKYKERVDEFENSYLGVFCVIDYESKVNILTYWSENEKNALSYLELGILVFFVSLITNLKCKLKNL